MCGELRAIHGIVVLVATAAACVPVGAFTCDDDTQCGAAGVCEPSGYCSTVDEGCESGRRYARYAPDHIAGSCVDPLAEGSPCLPAGRAATTPVLFYDFCEGEGTVVSSITAPPFPLQFEKGSLGAGFAWVDDGLRVDGEATALRSSEPIFDRLEACTTSGEVTLELWITPAFESQGGPTGIVAIGTPTANQSGTDIAVKMNPEWEQPGWVATLRTSADTDADGLQQQWLGVPFLRATHLVLVHGGGADTLWVDGEILLTQEHAGDLSTWNPNYDLVLANRPNYDVRNWAGTFHMLAFYCEALGGEAIATNHAAGHRPLAD